MLPLAPSPRNVRSSPPSSATWSGSPPPRSRPTPRTSTRCSRPTSRWPATRIEAHGGVVEKFIGDAVVGVFGVPAAHEDDPERAVRAGLRIAEDAEELEAVGGAPLKLRVGINTGEALVRLGITPGSGERFLAGDAINTASRIQSVAPEMGVGRRARHLRGHRRGLRLRRTRARDAQGQVRAGPGLPREEPAGTLRHRPHPHTRHSVHRTRDRPRAAQGHLRQDGRRELPPARHRRR